MSLRGDLSPEGVTGAVSGDQGRWRGGYSPVWLGPRPGIAVCQYSTWRSRSSLRYLRTRPESASRAPAGVSGPRASAPARAASANRLLVAAVATEARYQ